jgi:hypothetical protein
MSEQITVTCDNCGKSETAQGLVGWLQLGNHYAAVGTSTLNWVPWDGADLCGWVCLWSYAEKRAT